MVSVIPKKDTEANNFEEEENEEVIITLQDKYQIPHCTSNSRGV